MCFLFEYQFISIQQQRASEFASPTHTTQSKPPYLYYSKEKKRMEREVGECLSEWAALPFSVLCYCTIFDFIAKYNSTDHSILCGAHLGVLLEHFQNSDCYVLTEAFCIQS